MVRARGVHLTHHVDLDGTGVVDRHLQATALVAGAKGAAQLGLCGSHGQTAQVDGAIAGDGDRALGGDGMYQRALRGTVDIDDHLIAGAQDIGLRDGHALVGLETQGTLTEDVTAEHALALGIRGRVLRGLHIVLHLLHLLGGVGIDLTGGTALGGGQVLALGLVRVAGHALGGHLNGAVSGGADASLANLGVVLVAQPADLVDLHAAGHQFGHNLGLARAGLGFCSNEVNHLLVGHSLG